MQESEFRAQIDATLLQIEEAVEASGADIDYENQGGILTLSFSDGSHIILNGQIATRQLWVATRRNGLHFDWDAASGGWRLDRDQQPLLPLLAELISEQAGEAITLE